jgi:lactoylglutathione lyase
MATTIGNVAIEVSDLERSERFYVDVLGLQVLTRIDTPDVREVIVGDPDGGSQLMLASHAVPTGFGSPAGIWKVFVQTDDAPALYERAVAAGAEAVEPPRLLERFRVTIAFIRDPDGYLLELGQRHLD